MPDPTTTVEFPVEVFTQHLLPMVCVVSGAPATTTKKRVAETPMGAAWLGLLLGVIGFVIIRSITVKRATGSLPYNKDAARKDPAFRARRKNLLTGGLVAIIVGVVAVYAGGAAFDSESAGAGVSFVLGFVLFLGGVGALLFTLRPPLLWVTTVYQRSGARDTIKVTNAHPQFIAALAGNTSPYATYNPTGYGGGYSPHNIGATAFQSTGYGAAAPAAAGPAAGWYPDPAGSPAQRYWDGQAWTDHLS